MLSNFVVVIGSKPEIFLPDILPKKVYTANNAIERANFYKKKNVKIKLISVLGNQFFNYDTFVKNIIKFEPNEILTTNGKIDLDKYYDKNFISKIKYRYIENKGRDLQKVYFNPLTLRLGDISLIFSNKNYFYGIIRFIYNIFIKRRKPMGLSTGCLTMLIALTENINSKIIVTGIGLQGGNHYESSNKFYSTRHFYDFRGMTDAYLIKKLPKSVRYRILTTDLTFSKVANVRFINKNDNLLNEI